MKEIIQLLMIVSTAYLANLVIKATVDRWGLPLRGVRYGAKMARQSHWDPLKDVQGEWLESIRHKMRQAGYEAPWMPFLYLMLMTLVPLVLSGLALATRWPDPRGAMILLLMIPTLTTVHFKESERKISKQFEKDIYKVFKYLHHQTEAGILPTDSLRGIYQVVEEPILKKRLIKLSATYGQTLDLETALNQFKEGYGTRSAESLCIAIRQGIQTGENVTLLRHQERVMFQKYFHYIQEETNRMRSLTFAIVAIDCTIVVLMIGIPLWMETARALTRLFQQ